MHSALVRAKPAFVSAWQTSVAEWLVLSQCNIFVISESGFSKTAALVSLRPMSIYLLARFTYKSKRNEWKDECDPEKPANFELLGSRWSGV